MKTIPTSGTMVDNVGEAVDPAKSRSISGARCHFCAAQGWTGVRLRMMNDILRLQFRLSIGADGFVTPLNFVIIVV